MPPVIATALRDGLHIVSYSLIRLLTASALHWAWSANPTACLTRKALFWQLYVSRQGLWQGRARACATCTAATRNSLSFLSFLGNSWLQCNPSPRTTLQTHGNASLQTQFTT